MTSSVTETLRSLAPAFPTRRSASIARDFRVPEFNEKATT